MKYFSPSYWLKMWVLSAPLFNDKTQGINARLIDNNIKDWANENTTGISVVEQPSLNFSNSTDFINYQTQLDNQSWATNLTSISHHKHRHEKSRNRHKRQNNQYFDILNVLHNEYLYAAGNGWAYDSERRSVFTWRERWGEGVPVTQGTWKLEKINGNEYKIFNSFHSEYLYAAGNKYTVGFFKRKVFTWREGVPVTQGTWKLEKINGNKDDCQYKIFNSFHNEYLYAEKYGDVINGFDGHRRIIYTWLKRTQTITQISGEIWEFKNSDDYYNLKKDFLDYNKDKVNLGIIPDNFDNDIKIAIKHKYPSLFSRDIEIVSKTAYSHFMAGYSTKIHVSNLDEICFYGSYGKLITTFIYTTQRKLKELSNIIANDPKVKQWIEHINDYNKNLTTKIDQLKTYTDSQKWIAKNTEKEIIKGYIRDWTYIATLIEHEWKIEELNKNVQGLKVEFDIIKNKVNDLDNRVTNLENTSNWNCANIAGINSVVGAFIPVIGPIISAISGITAGACAIAGV